MVCHRHTWGEEGGEEGRQQGGSGEGNETHLYR